MTDPSDGEDPESALTPEARQNPAPPLARSKTFFRIVSIPGFWLFDCKSLEECIEWVRRCPNPMLGPSDIKIRPLFEPEDFGEEFTSALREQEARIRAIAAGRP